MDTIPFVKYRRIPHISETPQILDKPVEVYEKIDGGNTQIRRIDGRIFCGNRTDFLTKERLFTQEWFRDFQKWALGNYSFYNLPDNLVLFGEWTSRHTLDYNPEFTNKLFMLDILDMDSGRFIPYETAKARVTDLGIEGLIYLAPLFKGEINFKSLMGLIEGSQYRNGNKEGLVIKDYDAQKFAKLWASSVEKKGVVSLSDVENIVHGLRDSGISVDRQVVIRELGLDLERSKREVSSSLVKRIVREYFKDSENN